MPTIIVKNILLPHSTNLCVCVCLLVRYSRWIDSSFITLFARNLNPSFHACSNSGRRSRDNVELKQNFI